MTALTVFAPAKLNLYLHVTGKRADGYHLLDSLVGFLAIGDHVAVAATPENKFDFSVIGPMASVLKFENPGAPAQDNLVVKAARGLAAMAQQSLDGLAITLTKNLPVASGIGGGSADAAATIRALCLYWGISPDSQQLHHLAKSLGQDVPVCLQSTPAYFKGIGDETDPAPPLPDCGLLLINPRVPVSTPDVFKTRAPVFSPPARLEHDPTDAADLAAQLLARHNDLTDAACTLAPVIREVLGSLHNSPHNLLARMAGSGPTCFGLYPTYQTAELAAAAIHRIHPHWWMQPTTWYKATN